MTNEQQQALADFLTGPLVARSSIGLQMGGVDKKIADDFFRFRQMFGVSGYMSSEEAMAAISRTAMITTQEGRQTAAAALQTNKLVEAVNDIVRDAVSAAVENVITRIQQVEPEQAPAEPELMTVPDAARMLSISVRTADRKIARNEFPPLIKLGTSPIRYVRRDEVRLMAAGEWNPELEETSKR